MKNLKTILLILALMFLGTCNAFAAKLPDSISTTIKKTFRTDFRFDGVIILPDGTLYLPFCKHPALVKKSDQVVVKTTLPAGKNLYRKA